MRPILLMLLCACLSAAALAADDNTDPNAPVVSSSVDRAEVQVGESVVVRIKVLVPTWFTKSVYFDEVEALNVISLAVNKSSYPTSERIGNATWSGVIKEYTLIPMIGGRFQVPLPELTLHYSGADNQKAVVQITPEPVSFTATVPAGAASLTPLIIAQDLTLQQELTIEQPAAVGQSFNRKITASISGTSALFLPPLLSQNNSANLQSYPQSPQVNDSVDSRSGEVSGTRIDTQELIISEAGQVVLPDIEVRYYDLDTGTVQSVSVNGESFVVVAPPSKFGWVRPALIALAVLVVLLVVVRLLMPKWQAYRRSEPVKFRQLVAQSRKPDRQFLRDFEQWHRFWADAYQHSATLREAYHDTVLQVEASVYLSQPVPANVAQQLHQHRQALQSVQSHRAQRLVPLNP